MGRIGRSVGDEKCSKFDFLPSEIFSDFSSPCIYFSCAESIFRVFLKKEKHLRVEPACQWLSRHTPRPYWLPGAALPVATHVLA
jgi:hypothetical protein